MQNVQKSRVKVYANVRQYLELARKIFHQHQAAGPLSLLGNMEGFNWDATGPKIDFCYQKHREALELSRHAEEIYRQRDAVLAEITDTILASKMVIQQKHPFEPEKLREWGFLTTDPLFSIEHIPP